MNRRIIRNVKRGEPFMLLVDDHHIAAHEGETIATVLLAAGITGFHQTKSGRQRAPYCAMGVCFECLVELSQDNGHTWQRLRGCATLARPGLMIRTGGDA